MSKVICSLKDNINIHYHDDYFKKREADRLFKLFEEKITYNTDDESQIFIYGKYHKIPRKQVAYGEKGTYYTFSGQTIYAIDWNQDDPICNELRKIRDSIKLCLGEEVNFVLINRYKDGNDQIHYHSDDEKELGENPNIYGISFGAVRDILFRPTKNKHNNHIPKTITLPLAHGSLFKIRYPTNSYWEHSIPKRANKKVRISLTYRKMIY
jgi:alpha-ketoglutarate-dependent dioxygenase alkB family protein 2